MNPIIIETPQPAKRETLIAIEGEAPPNATLHLPPDSWRHATPADLERAIAGVRADNAGTRERHERRLSALRGPVARHVDRSAEAELARLREAAEEVLGQYGEAAGLGRLRAALRGEP